MHLFNNLHAFIWDSMTVNNCNSYLIDGPTRVLVDPGHLNLFAHVEKGLGNLNIQLDHVGLVICTHAHPDHIEAVQLFKKSKIPFAIHTNEWQLLRRMKSPVGLSSGFNPDSISPDFFLQEGDISINGLDLKILHTPGHSPGSICLYWNHHRVLFTGDLVFKEGIGRTDLPGGNGERLKESIRKLTHLDVEWLLPGHGPLISGKTEIQTNFNEIENFWFKYI